ncbi:Phosphoribosylamine--glycine ligase [invertebrate metagenome]|uniref:Phosphoribosylamine--glycine ligase n=1 Tax=invertebrate metagenome TaxID=1711999 RepID=A0A2H9T2Z8_9ZZZZ
MMKVLVIGCGGREHAIAWKVSLEPQVQHVFVAPGNAGTALENDVSNVPINVTAIDELLTFAKTERIDLTIVGPEAPLVQGIVDRFQQEGLPIFGPNKVASELEGSKVYAKDFLKRHNIPTADYQTFTEADSAKAYVEQSSYPVVIKADGLAAGKGVIIAEDPGQAFDAIDKILSENQFGEAGHKIIIEAFLRGEEASFIVMTDGKHILPLVSSQDHKARDEGDKGPNTGGMGAYSPAPVITPAIEKQIMETVITPTIEGMLSDGIRYCGFLYAGLMISKTGDIRVLEYNCRLGDPETQPILMRMTSSLAEACLDACHGELEKTEISWDSRPALSIVMAAGGYPDKYRKGDIISGIKESEESGVKVFHAGTRLHNNHHIATNGGRVLCVTATGKTIAEAQTLAYQGINCIRWPDCYYRNDIGYRALNRND